MTELLKDISTITGISKTITDDLTSLSIDIISHSIVEAIEEKNYTSIIDIGIGTLSIKKEEDNVMFKFIPSKQLEKVVKDTYKDKKSSLLCSVESSLNRRLMNTYKDLL